MRQYVIIDACYDNINLVMDEETGMTKVYCELTEAKKDMENCQNPILVQL